MFGQVFKTILGFSGIEAFRVDLDSERNQARIQYVQYGQQQVVSMTFEELASLINSHSPRPLEGTPRPEA